MLGEIVEFKQPTGRIIKGIVYCYMPNGDDDTQEAYIKVRDVRPYAVIVGQPEYKHYIVKLADPSLQVLTLDREGGAQLEEKYFHAAKTEDSAVRGKAPGSDDQDDRPQAEDD